jgi:hypothetical protein
MRKSYLLASFALSLLVVGCGDSSGGGTGGSGGHAGTGGHAGAGAGGSGGHAGAVGTGGASGAGGTAGAAGGHVGTGGAAGAGGSAGAAGGHAGTGGAAGAGGSAGAAGGHAGTGGAAGAGGNAGAAGGHAGTGGAAGAAGGAGGHAGTGGTSDGGVDALPMCGTDTDTSEGLTCTTLDATGGCVTATISNNPSPTAAGGNIQQGTYDLVSITVYAGDASAAAVLSPVRKTVVLTNGTGGVLNLQEADLSGSYLRRQSGTLSTSGNTLTYTQLCPAVDGGNQSGSADYTFTPGATPKLTIIENHDSHGFVVEVYQQRP